MFRHAWNGIQSLCKARNNVNQKRFLSIHEYLSMDILRSRGIRVPDGKDADSANEVKTIAEKLLSEPSCEQIFIKAQVLTGGRGKGVFDNGWKGGVCSAKNASAASEIAEKMIGHTLITKQTGTAGKPCKKVLVVQSVPVDKMYYVAFLMDRITKSPLLIVSNEGGMEIEEVAKNNPRSILKFPLEIDKDIGSSFAQNIASLLGIIDVEQQNDFAFTIQELFKLFKEKDATLLEINPLVTTTDKKIMCIDAKFNIDDNAHFRQQEIFSKRDLSQEDSREVQASKYSLNYIGLDGNIGCLVNGAGLAMATMDIIKMQGGEPANFLDVGGSATVEQVKQAFRIISSDKKVQCIFVNIFGGIMRCDIIAQGIIDAMKSLNINIPIIVRLQGTNEKMAKEMIEKSKLQIHFYQDLEEASKKAVQLIRN